MNREQREWDWPPERRTLYFDGTIQRRPSWWSTIGRIVFRAGVTVAATAVCVVLGVIAIGAMWLLIAIIRAAMTT
jgi:hypothetical protein